MNRILLLVLMVLVFGCSRSYQRSGDPKQQPVTKALKLMDQGRSDEAAYLLEQLHDSHPDNDELTVALASAYAGMAGIKITSFYELFYDVVFNRPLADLQGTSGSQKFRSLLGRKETVNSDRFQNPKQASMEMTLAQMREGLVMCLQLSDLLDKLPVIPPEKEMFLQEAVALLDNLVAPKRSHFAFRSLLRATLFKFDLNRRFSGVDSESDPLCRWNGGALVENFTHIDQQLSVLLKDVGQAYPRERSQLNKSRDRFHQLVNGLQEQIQSQGNSLFEQLSGC